MPSPIDFADKPTLVGDLVTLTQLAPEHTDAYFASLDDEESTRLTGTHDTFTKEQVQSWVSSRPAQDDRLDLAVIENSSGRYCGEAVILAVDQANLSCGFRIALNSNFTGMGYGTEATRLLVNHVFATTPTHRIGLEVYSFNPRAQHVYRKVGFRQEGVMRDALFWDSEWVDSVLMSVLRTDQF